MKSIIELIQTPILEPITTPILREKIEVVVADGKRVSAYKDEWDKVFLKEAGLYLGMNGGRSR